MLFYLIVIAFVVIVSIFYDAGVVIDCFTCVLVGVPDSFSGCRGDNNGDSD